MMRDYMRVNLAKKAGHTFCMPRMSCRIIPQQNVRHMRGIHNICEAYAGHTCATCCAMYARYTLDVRWHAGRHAGRRHARWQKCKMTPSDYGELGKLYGLNRKLMGVKKGVKFYLCIHNLLLKYPQIPANTSKYPTSWKNIENTQLEGAEVQRGEGGR